MHIEQILENDTVKVTMTAERESLTAFPIPEPLSRLPFKKFAVYDEHGNFVSGYDLKVFAEYVELYPALFPNWSLCLMFDYKKGIQE